MPRSDYHDRAAAEAEETGRLVRETAHQLRTDPAYQAYFAGYDPASVEHFIACYANHKIHWQQKGPGLLNWRIGAASEFRTEAYKRLWEIQQKKLFDVQDRWRAGEVALPDVTVSAQFHRHLTHVIHELDWLPAITPAEMALYRDYLLSDECRDVGSGPDVHRSREWQRYDHMRETALAPDPGAVAAPTEYPAWYRYYDAHTGTRPFQRPDRRGERERFYQDLARDEAHANLPASTVVLDERPWWYEVQKAQNRDLFAEFAQLFDADTPQLLALRDAYNRGTGRQLDSRLLDGLLMNVPLLLNAQERLPLADGAPDWRTAVVDLGNQLRKTLLAVALEEVYEDEYLLRQQTGLALAPPDPNRKSDQYAASDLNRIRERILRGRELNGEPRDFNY